MTSIQQDDSIVNTDFDPQQLSQTLLESHCFIFAEEGLKGKVLQAKLEELNAGFDPPADTDFLLELVNRYPAPEPEGPTPLQLLQTIIDTGDIEKLYTDETIKFLAVLKQLNPISYALNMGQIKETFGKKLNLVDFKRSIAYAQRTIEQADEEAKPDIADIAYTWATEHRQFWGYDTNYNMWRVWNGTYWEEQKQDHELNKHATGAIHDAELSVNSRSGKMLFKEEVEAHCLRTFEPKSGLINFSNGTLELATGQLRPYDKEDSLTYCLPYDYNQAGTHPNIDLFLAEVLPDEYARLALMAHIGLALIGDLLIHAFMGLIGKPRSGKSTILALINAVCGASQQEASSFAGHHLFSRDLEGKRSRYTWSNRLAVCVDELPPEALKEEEILKAMSAHGGVEMRGMFKDEQTNNRWKPKLVFTANERPRYRDNSGAIKERAIFAEIMQARPKEQRDPRLFVKKLLPERDAFAASCIELAQQVLERGYYPFSKEMKRLLDSIANEANPLKDFLREKCIIDGDPGTRESTKAVYDAFVEYCEDNAIDKKYRLAKNTFSLTLHNMHIGIVPKHIKFDGQLKRGLAGMRLRTIDDGDPIEPTYADDPPLANPKRLTVVNGGIRSISETVNRFEQPVERNEQGRLTVLTVEESNKCVSNKCVLENGSAADSNIHTHYNKQYRGESPLTPLTVDTNEPVGRDEQVNGLKNAPLTTVNQNSHDRPCFHCGELLSRHRSFDPCVLIDMEVHS